MVKIKLAGTGSKNRLSYRIVVAEAKSKLKSKVIETLGFYDPKTKPATVKIKKDRLNYWLAKGAVPTATVRKLSEKHG
jgi:small subunit ribosomal protein S16